MTFETTTRRSRDAYYASRRVYATLSSRRRWLIIHTCGTSLGGCHKTCHKITTRPVRVSRPSGTASGGGALRGESPPAAAGRPLAIPGRRSRTHTPSSPRRRSTRPCLATRTRAKRGPGRPSQLPDGRAETPARAARATCAQHASRQPSSAPRAIDARRSRSAIAAARLRFARRGGAPWPPRARAPLVQRRACRRAGHVRRRATVLPLQRRRRRASGDGERRRRRARRTPGTESDASYAVLSF